MKNWFAVIGFVVVALVVGVCVSCGDDDDDSMGWQPTSHRDDRDYSGDRDKGRNSRGDCEGAETCDERDFSPELTDSPVTICVQPGSCDFGGEEEASVPGWADPRCAPFHCDPAPSTSSLFKLDPVLLVKTIQEGATAIGTAAGTMAGAIAAFPIGILL